jgi:hypothetical protein
MGCNFFQPDVVVVVKSRFIVIDKDGGCDVHRVDPYQAFGDTACMQTLLHLGGYVDEGTPGGDFKPEFFAVAFHCDLLC